MYVDDVLKVNCCVMLNRGFCIVCIGKCIWFDYKNEFYIFRYLVDKVRKIYIDMK